MGTSIMPVVSKIFCSSYPVSLMIRKRPNVANGGGFVVMSSNQRVLFSVDGCGTLGSEKEMIIRDGDGSPVLFICKKDGIFQALTSKDLWKGYLMDFEGVGRSTFSLKQHKSCFGKPSGVIRVSLDPNGKGCNFEVKGSFVERACSLVDSSGNVVAQVGVKEEIKKMMIGNDLYHVTVEPGYDQAFVVGVIAILDNIYGESTRC